MRSEVALVALPCFYLTITFQFYRLELDVKVPVEWTSLLPGSARREKVTLNDSPPVALACYILMNKLGDCGKITTSLMQIPTRRQI